MEKSLNEQIMDLLAGILDGLPSAAKANSGPLSKAEAVELVRLHTPRSFYEALLDFLLALESLHYISSDYQLRLKAEDIWKQQLDVFRSRMKPVAEALITAALELNIDLSAPVGELIGQ